MRRAGFRPGGPPVPCLLSLEVFSKHLTLRYGRARPGVNPEILSFAGIPLGSLPKRTESWVTPALVRPAGSLRVFEKTS
jgi:hypothetical protein